MIMYIGLFRRLYFSMLDILDQRLCLFYHYILRECVLLLLKLTSYRFIELFIYTRGNYARHVSCIGPMLNVRSAVEIRRISRKF